MTRPLHKAALLFVAVLLLPAAPTIAADAEWLLVGNSYTASNDLKAVLQSVLLDGLPHWTDVEVLAHNPGGRLFAQHLADADGSNGDTALRDLLVTGGHSWDVVVLQEQSQVPGFPMTQPEWQQSRDGAVGLDALVAAQGADTLFFGTWGRRDGDTQNAWRFPDYSTMQGYLDEGYDAYRQATSTELRPTFVAPAGTAFQRVHDDLVASGVDPTTGDTLFTRLYDADGSHPAMPGTYLTALVLYGTWTGRDPADITWAPASVAPADAQALRGAASAVTWQAWDGVWPMPWVVGWDAYEAPTDGPTGVYSISGADRWPLVVLEAAADPLATLGIGTSHGGVAGSGRLRVDGGTLSAVAAQMADEADSWGQLLVVDGDVQLDAVTLGDGAASIDVHGGAVQLGTCEVGIHVAGGAVAPVGDSPRWDVLDLQAGGVLTLVASASTVPLDLGALTALGTIYVAYDGLGLEENQELVLLTAPVLDLGATTVVVPEQLAWEVRDVDGGQALVVVVGELPDPPEIPDPADLIEDAIQDALGCGSCGGEPAEEGAAGALFLVVLLGFRRRW